MLENAVGNNDRCGRCKAKHGGNSHTCQVHGAVSQGCCEESCNPAEWVWVSKRNPGHPTLTPPGKIVRRDTVDLAGYTMDPPYSFQNDGEGQYKPGCVVRYILEPVDTDSIDCPLCDDPDNTPPGSGKGCVCQKIEW